MFLKGQGLKEFEFRTLKFLDFVTRWTEGPRIVDNVSPVVVNFSCLDDQVLVWNCLKDGCKTSRVKVTKDSRSVKEKESFSKTFLSKRKVTKVKKKSDFHANCGGPSSDCGHDENENFPEDDSFSEGDRALLVHGVESDWVEEEMMEDDLDFIRDVLETKVYKILKSVGIQKKVKFENAFRWKEGPQHKEVCPVVIVFKKRCDGSCLVSQRIFKDFLQSRLSSGQKLESRELEENNRKSDAGFQIKKNGQINKAVEGWF